MEVIKYASNELKNDKEIVLKAVQINGLTFSNASDKLKNDKDSSTIWNGFTICK